MNDAVFLRLGLTVILCLSGLVFQRTKIISILQMGWIMIITCFNTMSVDWLSNFEIYQNSTETFFRRCHQPCGLPFSKAKFEKR